MIVSHDFEIRMVGLLEQQVPDVKEDVDDDKFHNVLGFIGQFQRFLDVSRCSRLTPSIMIQLQRCKSLNYLDVSYTKFNNFNVIIENCYNLKSLCLSGLDIPSSSFESLSQLPSLEFLALTNSSISTVEPCKDMLMLRSLHLGQTNISSITPLGYNELTRLEELAIDDCKNFQSNKNKEFLNTIKKLTGLKTLNVCGTELQNIYEDIMSVLPSKAILESKTRREIFLEAIINNDDKEVRYWLSCGQDINMRIGIWANDILLHNWREKCRAGKIQAPFFLIDHPSEDLRPMPIDLAIFYCAKEVMRTLLLSGANINHKVWFSDVNDDGNKFVVNQTMSKQREFREFDTKDLPTAVYDRNVHRLVLGMVARKIATWKADIGVIKDEIIEIFNDPSGMILLKQRMTQKYEAGEKYSRPPTREVASLLADSKDTDDMQSLFNTENDNNLISEEKPFALMTREEKGLAIMRKRQLPTFKPKLYMHWRGHAMVSRLSGNPFTIKASNIMFGKNDQSLLGKKDFWFESKGITLKNKLKHEEAIVEREIASRKLQNRRASTTPGIPNDENKKDDHHHVPVQEIMRSLYTEEVGTMFTGKKKKFPAAYTPKQSDVEERHKTFQNLIQKESERRYREKYGKEDDDDDEYNYNEDHNNNYNEDK